MAKKAEKAKSPAAFKVECAWDKIKNSELKLLETRCKDYLEFISRCKTERGTIEFAEKLINKAGFKPLAPLGQNKKLKPGSKVYFINKSRAMGLAVIGKRPVSEGFRFIAAHHDVPRIDIKAQPLYEKHGLALFKTHYYGGIKKFQWAAIPLSLHIFAIDRAGKNLSFVIGEKPGDPVFTITDIAPHIGKKIQYERKTADVLAGEELNIVVGNRPMPLSKDQTSETPNRVKNAVLEYFETNYHLTEEDIAWAEIRAVPALAASEVGFDRALIGAYGHDDRACVGAALAAITEMGIPEHTAAVMFYDKEEIGSAGPNGAQSMLTTDFLSMLTEATSGDSSFATIRTAIRATMVLSADTNAPIDPTFEGAYDPLNSGVVGKGVWITKHSGSAGKSGSSEADIEYLAYIRRLLSKENIPYQFGEMGKVDEGGGGTVAYLLANLNMNVVDISLPTLSLHSPFELISKIDYHYSVSAYKAFLQNSYL
ncbi:MAG TPA: aminopeptidase [Candidatus Riflebacteria bacterium]|jgi:aspartyl aminopeptidase|nr:aminopeptidase [Candidatus Riflebacteria bacterium]